MNLKFTMALSQLNMYIVYSIYYNNKFHVQQSQAQIEIHLMFT